MDGAPGGGWPMHRMTPMLWVHHGIVSNSVYGPPAMKHQTKSILILLSISMVTMIAGSQSPTEDRSLAQATQARGYWVDPSTGLMWAARDNGKDITWGKAIKYCSNLRSVGYSDWRLPTVDELSNIYDGSGFMYPHPKDVIPVLAGRAKGGLLLTGAREWSSSRVLDDRGHRTGYAWEYDFPHGGRWKDPLGYTGSLRALCVRHP